MPDQTATTLFFVIRRIYQTRSVIVAAPQKAAGRREAKSVKPKKLYEALREMKKRHAAKKAVKRRLQHIAQNQEKVNDILNVFEGK